MAYRLLIVDKERREDDEITGIRRLGTADLDDYQGAHSFEKPYTKYGDYIVGYHDHTDRLPNPRKDPAYRRKMIAVSSNIFRDRREMMRSVVLVKDQGDPCDLFKKACESLNILHHIKVHQNSSHVIILGRIFA